MTAAAASTKTEHTHSHTLIAAHKSQLSSHYFFLMPKLHVSLHIPGQAGWKWHKRSRWSAFVAFSSVSPMDHPQGSAKHSTELRSGPQKNGKSPRRPPLCSSAQVPPYNLAGLQSCGRRAEWAFCSPCFWRTSCRILPLPGSRQWRIQLKCQFYYVVLIRQFMVTKNRIKTLGSIKNLRLNNFLHLGGINPQLRCSKK